MRDGLLASVRITFIACVYVVHQRKCRTNDVYNLLVLVCPMSTNLPILRRSLYFLSATWAIRFKEAARKIIRSKGGRIKPARKWICRLFCVRFRIALNWKWLLRTAPAPRLDDIQNAKCILSALHYLHNLTHLFGHFIGKHVVCDACAVVSLRKLLSMSFTLNKWRRIKEHRVLTNDHFPSHSFSSTFIHRLRSAICARPQSVALSAYSNVHGAWRLVYATYITHQRVATRLTLLFFFASFSKLNGFERMKAVCLSVGVGAREPRVNCLREERWSSYVSNGAHVVRRSDLFSPQRLH